jgi:hypothetical protein
MTKINECVPGDKLLLDAFHNADANGKLNNVTDFSKVIKNFYFSVERLLKLKQEIEKKIYFSDYIAKCGLTSGLTSAIESIKLKILALKQELLLFSAAKKKLGESVSVFVKYYTEG